MHFKTGMTARHNFSYCHVTWDLHVLPALLQNILMWESLMPWTQRRAVGPVLWYWGASGSKFPEELCVSHFPQECVWASWPASSGIWTQAWCDGQLNGGTETALLVESRHRTRACTARKDFTLPLSPPFELVLTPPSPQSLMIESEKCHYMCTSFPSASSHALPPKRPQKAGAKGTASSWSVCPLQGSQKAVFCPTLCHEMSTSRCRHRW